jgi:hypothetical protein
MLTSYDEFLCHQIVSTLDHVDTSDRQWTEKIWFTAHDNSGKTLVSAGFGKYTNRNVMDGYGIVALEGTRQYNIRASRELHPNSDVVEVGPLSYEVIEPLKKVRICLGENDQGIGFNLEFEGRVPPSEEHPPQFQRVRGTVVNHLCRYYQFGHVSGKVTVEGKTYDVKKDRWWSQRDHSWGIRPLVGVPPPGSGWSRVESADDQGLQPKQPIPGGKLYAHLVAMQFQDYALYYTAYETPDGKALPLMAPGYLKYRYGDPRCGDPKHEPRVIEAEHRWEFFPNSKRVKACKARVTTEDGVIREVSIKPLITSYARAGGYLGFRGWVHGKWMGPYAIAGERLDLTDEKIIAELMWSVDDHMCEYRCGEDLGYGVMDPFVLFGEPNTDFSEET